MWVWHVSNLFQKMIFSVEPDSTLQYLAAFIDWNLSCVLSVRCHLCCVLLQNSGARLSQSENEADKQPSSSTGEKTHALRLGRGSGKKETQIGSHGKKPLSKPKGPTQVERSREEYEKKRQEEEAVRKERQEAYAKQQVAREKSKQERKDVQNKLRKKTKKGQPVMKHRMEHLLDTLQRQLQE